MKRLHRLLVVTIASSLTASSLPAQSPWTATPNPRFIRDTVLPDWGSVGVVGPDGRLYLAVMKPTGIVALNEDGRIGLRIGREGKGPGEFARVSNLGFIGDTLWVHDNTLFRISYFARDGKLIRTEPLRVEDKENRGTARASILGVLPDHSLIATAPLPSRIRGVSGANGSLLVRLSAPGVEGDPVSILDSIGFIDPTGGSVIVSLPNGGSVQRHPWARGDRVVVAPDGTRFAMLTQSTDGYTITTRDASTQAYKVTIKTKPVPLDGAVVDEWINDEVMRWSKTPIPTGDLDLKQALRKGLGEIQFMPTASDALISSDRSVWVRREGIRQDLASAGDSVRWDVIDSRGRVSASLFLPGTLRLLGVRRNVIWGLNYDNDEEAWVVAQYVVKRR
jgi:hypothetical protein